MVTRLQVARVMVSTAARILLGRRSLMVRLCKTPILAIGILAAFGMTAGIAQATVITITDVNEGAPVGIGLSDVTDGAHLVAFFPIGTEGLLFVYQSSAISAVTTSISRALTDPDGFASDRLRLFFREGSNMVVGIFASDPLTIARGRNFFSPIREDGTAQSLIFTGTLDSGTTNVFSNAQVGGGTLVDTFRVQSDVEVVPEPSTLVLSGLSALGLLGYVWRRRRTVAALASV